MLQLPDVTLVLADTSCHELSTMAVQDCLKVVNFGGMAIFSDKNLKIGDQHYIDDIDSVETWSQFFWYEVPQHIKTSHLLLIHWDSWITDPGMWNPDWLKYDYIGAPWYENDVGNGGFSLRSKRLMDYLVEHKDELPCLHPEDTAVCRKYREHLERQGFKWPNLGTAFQFSIERVRADKKARHFGFHGVFNWGLVLKGAALHYRVQLAYNNPYIRQRGMA